MSRIREVLRGVRAGDDAAVNEFVRVYGPHVRRIVRARLRVASLRRIADPSDIYQSVLASFLIRAALGQYELEQTGDVKGLLRRMALNKLATLARRAEFHGRRPPVSLDRAAIEPVAPGPTPDDHALWKELLRQAWDRLADDERRLLDLRLEGCTWEEVAARHGGGAEARRKQLARALERIDHELHLGDGDDD